MKCPECKSSKIHTHFTDTSAHDLAVVRRRECADCGHRWTTIEIDMEPIMVHEISAVLELAAKLGPAEEKPKRPWMRPKPKEVAADG